MADFKVVISDPKTGKSYQKVLQDESLIGMQLGDKLNGEVLGLPEYELKITGGSDNAGFPMRSDIPGTLRKKPLLSGGVGVKVGFTKQREKGLRIRKTVNGNTINPRIVQVNVSIVKHGSKPIDELLGKKEEAQ